MTTQTKPLTDARLALIRAAAETRQWRDDADVAGMLLDLLAEIDRRVDPPDIYGRVLDMLENEIARADAAERELAALLADLAAPITPAEQVTAKAYVEARDAKKHAAITARAEAAERALVGLRAAAEITCARVWVGWAGPEMTECGKLTAALADASPIADRVIAEAEERGVRAALDADYRPSPVRDLLMAASVHSDPLRGLVIAPVVQAVIDGGRADWSPVVEYVRERVAEAEERGAQWGIDSTAEVARRYDLDASLVMREIGPAEVCREARESEGRR